jgi:hypothetical protein
MSNDTWPSDAAQYVTDQTRFLIERFGPREPGSEVERNAQGFIQRELETSADEVRAEPFLVASKAFLAFLPIAGILMAAAIVLYRPFPVMAFLLCAAALLITFLEFIRYRQFLDPLFPKGESVNVYALRRATNTPTRRIILCGHIDSAFEMRFNLMGRLPLTLAALSLILTLGCLLALTGANLFLGGYLASSAPMFWKIAQAWRWAGLIGCAAAILFIRFSVVVPGANDNLTGTFCAMAVFQWFKEQGLRFDDTEIGCLIAGSEEAGLRGAKAFVERHRDELKTLDTAVIVLDTLRDQEHLAVCVRDLNGTVPSHPGVNDLLRQAGARLNIPIGNTVVYMGSTDATAFSQAGIPATALSAMDPSPPRYYHTRLDTWTNMDPVCIEKALAVLREAVLTFDRDGLPQAKRK